MNQILSSAVQLPKLNFKENYEFKIRTNKDKLFIYDTVRKSWVVLTPEEWVRQHWVAFLIESQGKSLSSLILEQKIILNQQTKRIDLLLTEKTLPKILFEFKAPQVPVTEKVFEQVARYNSIIQAENIVLSNGYQHVFAYLYQGKYRFVPHEEFFNRIQSQS
ncbi:type I restriction enzyme HsdR N-terminal domain-containing protein [Bergeyella zoohelcum]|uniref:Type I restriction-modification enzyme M subunit n=1 Tax=Bergeyella zoohelcum TaxID=1015 RepID=A0A7Z8YLK2_9FLAO|nr:type I restriction enzyme HsdR N-terminal domain-containing protein [Bergeyella zoohelcum]VDH02612.1 Type I restriction-modification enzyme M subunit [Bergeyella zoohelcum]